ncbi:MAG: hypothetical protein KGI83_01780 [Verrucomicrobiota bacterium]|nr:hypothetical protein [Verrucomicrobiota bacterium]
MFGAALGHLLGAKILTLVVLSTVVVLGGASEMNRSRYEAAERQNSTDWLYMIASDTPPARYLPRICPEEIAVRTLDLGDRELSSIRPDEVPFTKYGQDQFGRRFLAMPVRGDVVVVHERYVDGSEWVLSGCPRRFSWIPFDPHDPARFFRVIQVQYQCDGNPLVFDIALQNYRRQQAGRAAPLEGTQPGAHGIYPGLTTHTGIDNNG